MFLGLNASEIRDSARRLLAGEFLFPRPRAESLRRKPLFISTEIVEAARDAPRSHAGHLLDQALSPMFFRNRRLSKGILTCGRAHLRGNRLIYEEPLVKGVRRRDRRGRLRELIAAAHVLERAHEVGVVHMDIKPDHILSAENGRVYVLDWDAALPWRKYSRIGGFGLCGTPRYMSPEQAVGNLKLIRPATDVFSLGLILYEILNRAPARPGVGGLQAELALARDVPVNCSIKVWERFPALSETCEAALAAEPAARPASAGEFAEALRTATSLEISHGSL